MQWIGKRLGLILITGLLCVCPALRPASAAEFPEKEIRLIVPYKAGGQSDLFARKMAELAQTKNLSPKPLLVVDIPGGNTAEGLRTVLNATPDGYTLGVHHTSITTMKSLGQVPMSYKDFDLICQTLDMPFALVVHADAPWNTASEFVEDVRRNPGKYSMAAPGMGGGAHFAGLLFLSGQGILDKVKHVPFDGGAEAATAVMARRVDIRPASFGDAARFVRSGQQKLLVLLYDKKLPGFEETPIASDIGLKDYFVQRQAIFAPKNTPAAVKQKLASMFKAIVETPEFQEFTLQMGSQVHYMDEAEVTEIYSQDEKIINEFAKIITGQK